MSKPSNDSRLRQSQRPDQFATTHWSVVLAAGRRTSTHARRSLAVLCQGYWYPLYCYVRRQGYSAHDAQDLTQEFFLRLLAKNSLSDVCPERGRFRAFLLAALKHFLSNERDRARAKKRGGGQKPLSLDFRGAEERFVLEPVDESTPEKIYDRCCAVALVESALERLETDYRRSGKGPFFERFKGTLTGERGASTYDDLARELGMTTGAVKVAVHRLRKRFRRCLRDEIAQTVSDPAEVDDELRDLFGALE
ncbi:MAG TPA: sigma-70 family RNA polymerase sigma factor [Pirellulales bacterium]|nr:sigma-70 family RNA polymerase sigma factor [Pirellulales bacterium]